MRNISLIGNPNTGKTTIFNLFTGGRNHTGNWSGKTVEKAKGSFFHNEQKWYVTDLPGTYSIIPSSEEESVSIEYLAGALADIVVVVCDATALERNLFLLTEIKEIRANVIVALTLIDVAKKQHINIDTDKIESIFDITIVKINGKTGHGMNDLKKAISEEPTKKRTLFNKFTNLEQIDKINKIHEFCNNICTDCVTTKHNPRSSNDRVIDNIVLKKTTGIPILLLIVGIIFWLTIVATNIPSDFLAKLFVIMGNMLYQFFTNINTPIFLKEIIVNGAFKTVGWVVSVMLPPMTVFFPLFTLLEDFGLLPRIAFILDGVFQKAGTSGKHALTMLMGFGCNAVGVTSSRIFENENNKLIAILTNNFIPCNGRFPTIVILISIFLSTGTFSTIVLLLLFTFASIIVAMLVSYFLSKCILKDNESPFLIELPDYRMPNVMTILKTSFLERTIFVLGRAVTVALPAGIIIWLMQNTYYDNVTIFTCVSNFFDPMGRFLGLNGVILTAFILGLPANEIVLPIVFMSYTSGNSLTDISSLSNIRELLVSHGFTTLSAICMIVFAYNHYPCGTTLLTIKKETKSNYYTFLAFLLPTFVGIILCAIINFIGKL